MCKYRMYCTNSNNISDDFDNDDDDDGEGRSSLGRPNGMIGIQSM